MLELEELHWGQEHGPWRLRVGPPRMGSGDGRSNEEGKMESVVCCLWCLME